MQTEKRTTPLLDLAEETLMHFSEGVRSVKAYSNDHTYIITRSQEEGEFWVTLEEPGFPKKKTTALQDLFHDVFGIEAHY